MQKIIKEIRDAIIVISSLPIEGYVVCIAGRYAVHYDCDDGYALWDYPIVVLDKESAFAIADEAVNNYDISLINVELVSDYKEEALDALNKALACLVLNDYYDEC